uniref:Deoxyribonuclease II n=1 Tax=Plectus sambesii TaxID=2011161 RepID=A0A914VG89_9BILA
MLTLVVSLVAAIQLAVYSVDAYECRDMSNQSVDWWMIYKLPEGSGTVPDGLGFYYMDANIVSFTMSNVSVNQSNHALAYTMAQYYNAMHDPNTFHVMYNDEPPGTKDAEHDEEMAEKAVEYGHTKGVSFFNSATGIWLIHSVPTFPNPSSYSWPAGERGIDYGQSMLCISMNYDQLASIGTQLFYNHPHIYSSQLPAFMVAANPDLAKVIGKKYQQGTPTSSIKRLVSSGGIAFTSFAKTADFKADLYDGIIAPSLGAPLLVETWRRNHTIPLVCNNSHTVLDVQDIHILKSNAFKYTKDHSKWAVTASGGQMITCIGDINRMTSQYERGGGAVCIKNFYVWSAYKNTIVDTNHC